MRIHTDATEEQVRSLNDGLPTHYHALTFHGSRTHQRAIEVRLSGSGGRNNTGLYGAGDYDGATWDEWGAFFAALYAVDPTARCGGSANAPVYSDAEDFHWQTASRFLNGMPGDAHPRHRWVYEGTSVGGRYAVHVCGKCGAMTRRELRMRGAA